MTISKIGYLGPGLMGRGIIENLLKHGFEVMILPHQKPIDELIKKGAHKAKDLNNLTEFSEVIMMTLPDSPEIEKVIFGAPSLISLMKKKSILIDLSTSYPSSTIKISKCLKEKGIDMLDAPLTGGPAQAIDGTLNVMVGGENKIYEKCTPIFQAIAKNIFYVGKQGSGHQIKLINNFLGQLNNAAIAEILIYASKVGLDIHSLYDVVKVSGGYSKTFDAVVPKILEKNSNVSFKLKMVHKDLTYMKQLGSDAGIPLPMVNQTLQIFDMAKAYGLGDKDFSSVTKLWEDLIGFKVS